MSASYNSTGEVTRTPIGFLPLYSRAKRVPGGVEVAGAGDPTYGSVCREGYAQSTQVGHENLEPEEISIKITNAPGTHFAIAGGAIPEAGEFEGADDGKVVALDAGVAIGFVEESGGADADGHIVEVVYYSQQAI